jgi:hypothetical protein
LDGKHVPTDVFTRTLNQHAAYSLLAKRLTALAVLVDPKIIAIRRTPDPKPNFLTPKPQTNLRRIKKAQHQQAKLETHKGS